MKIARYYLWFFNPFLNIVEIRSFNCERTLENWYYDSGLLGKAMVCYSISDVTELLRKRSGDALVSYIK